MENRNQIESLPMDEIVQRARAAYKRFRFIQSPEYEPLTRESLDRRSLDLIKKRSQIRGDLKEKDNERKDLLQQAQEAHKEFNAYKRELNRRIFNQQGV